MFSDKGAVFDSYTGTEVDEGRFDVSRVESIVTNFGQQHSDLTIRSDILLSWVT